jgi:hypothetical protein
VKKIILVLATAAIFNSCIDLPTDVSVPIWDSELRLPITQQSYRIGDIVNLDDEVSIDSTLQPFLYKINTEDYDRQVEIGDFADGLIDADYIITDVPVGTLDTTAVFDLPEGNLIYESIIESGRMRVTYQNPSQNSMEITITLPALTRNGTPFTVQGTAPGGGTLDETRSINGYTYNPDAAIGYDKLVVGLDASANLSPETADLRISISETTFEYVDGQLAARAIGFINESIDLDIPDDTKELRNKIEFHDARMFIDVTYLTGNSNIFDADLRGPRIVGFAENDSIVLTLSDGSAIPDLELRNGRYFIIYDQENSNISDFLSFMPTEIIVRGEVYINPNEERGEISNTDLININMALEINSVLSINQASFTESEDINFDEDDRENLRQAKRIMLFYELENEVPILTDVNLEILGASGQILFTEALSLRAGSSNIGSPIEMNTYRDSILIDNQEMELFPEAFAARFEVILSTEPQDSETYFSPDQTLSIKAWADVTVEVDLDEEEDEQ